MAKSQKNTAGSLKEIGQTGLSVYSGRINEESILKLADDGWITTVKDMLNDAVINGMLNAIEMLARQVPWDVTPFSEDPEDAKDADFIRSALFDDMSITWQDTLSEIFSFIPWGWSYFEICYKRRGGETRDKTTNSRFTDGKIGWRKFAIRAQESLFEWKFDEFNEVTAMVQRPAPDYMERTIPIDKALHFRTSSHKGNPEGRSLLRGAYREWYFKVNIQNIEGIGIERDLAGLPVVYAPRDVFDKNNAESVTLLAELRKMVKEVRRDETEGIVMPTAVDAKGNKEFEFTLLSTGGRRQFDTSATISRCDHRMLLSILADFMMLGSQGVGSYALSSDKTELFTTAMHAWLDSVCETFNRKAIPELQKLNGRPSDRSPKLTHGPVEKTSLSDLGEYLNKLSGVGLDFDDEEKAWLKRQAGVPVTKKEDADETDDKKARDQKDETDDGEDDSSSNDTDE